MLLLHDALAHPKWVDHFVAKAHSTGAVLEDLQLEKLQDVLVASAGGDAKATTALTAASAGHILEGVYFAVAHMATLRETMWGGCDDEYRIFHKRRRSGATPRPFLCIARSPESRKTGLSRVDMVRAYGKPGRSAIVISAQVVHADRARHPLRWHYLCRRAATVAQSDLPPIVKLVDLTQWKRVLRVLDMDPTLRCTFLAKVAAYVLLLAQVPAPLVPMARTAIKRSTPSTPTRRLARPIKAMRMSPSKHGSKQILATRRLLITTTKAQRTTPAAALSCSSEQLASLLQTTIDGLHQMQTQLKLLTTTVLTTSVQPAMKTQRRRHSSCN
ncbi:hypothetical protein SDRG_02173 [Saprolegnia diclina VS20]|uniref:Uncharacterized protein n=1 Tax=Saprolegnia diclina (strain VS20) TaxID=1156394 RepID=T0QQ55_SAPDV|nr:hypothetical protein SDRG_02173 [Saprolegnia diclina VS20]EQC40269.1 hypothetical protein SDRG_02173 [Saprolegnia diclina VS20]|eukprot:XP_008605968.1 hypothetical protein SDRG_02173 [Saprolegnia diclina VS20]